MSRNRHRILTTLLALTALAAAGCSSDLSPVAPVPEVPEIVEAPDAAPPAIPTGLAAATGNGVVKLAWQPNLTDVDLAGFLVYRLAFDEALPLTEAPIPGTTFIDTRPLSVTCQYAVTSVDQAGNESGWALVAYLPQPELPQRHAE